MSPISDILYVPTYLWPSRRLWFARVANVIKDFLSSEGMQVDSCGNGMIALRILTGDARYDVVIVDNDLPGLSGLELARRVRKITHRRKIQIMLRRNRLDYSAN